MSTLAELARQLRESAGIAHKRDIGKVVRTLGRREMDAGVTAVPVGDDCAAIPDGDGYLLFAIEGMLGELVAAEPWFAGYCSVLVNVSDIYAMGGRPLAVVDALWSRGGDAAQPLLDGMAAAAERYQVPVVGGHSNRRSVHEQLAVAITGRARRLLTSFDAEPGQNLVVALDLRGQYHEPYNYWNASTEAPPQRLRDDLELLPRIAEDGLCGAAKDISMAGVVGTMLMLLECSGIGADIDVDAIPLPPGVPLARWLETFPSYGFILSVDDDRLDAVAERFRARGLACAAVGRTGAARAVHLSRGGDKVLLWDFGREQLTGCGPATPSNPHQENPYA